MIKKIILLLMAMFVVQDAFALNVQNHRFTFHGGRLDTLVESAPKPKDTLTLGFSTNLAIQPFEFGSSTGAAARSIVDYGWGFDLGASYSFSDRAAIGINVPFHVTSNIVSLTNLAKEMPMSFGDISLAGQVNLISREDNTIGAGLGVVPYLTFPTGSAGNFVGDASVTGGFFLAGDIENNGHYGALNVGMRFRKEENILNLRVAQEFVYAAGYHHAILEEQQFDGFVELSGSLVMNGINANSTPIEPKIGFSKVFMPDTPVTVKLVNGVGIGNGYGNPDYRAVLSVSYDHLLPRTKIIEKTVTIERVEKVEQQLQELTIYYPTDGAQVDPFYDQKIAGIALVMKQNPDLGPLYIIGHTDDVGGDDYNKKLSEKRAKQAYESILQYGLAAKNVVWFGVGESDHVAANDTDTNRALNRRTVFTFKKPRQIMESGENLPAKQSDNVSSIKPETDSYTETLKRGDKEGFVDDHEKIETPIVTRKEEVRVREETRVINGEDDAVAKNTKDKTHTSRQKNKKSRRHKKNDYQEQDLKEKVNFDEPFVE